MPWSEVVEGINNRLELIGRLHKMGSTHTQIVHPELGPTGCAGLLLLLALADITNNGKSNNNKFCPVRQAAEVIADYLPGQKSALTKRFCSSFPKAAEVLLRNDKCPFKIQRFDGTGRGSAPPHVEKYGAKMAYYVTGDIYQSLQLPWLK